MNRLNLADNTAEEILARALQSNIDKADYESEAAKRVEVFNKDLSTFRSELSKRIKKGEGTGNHLYDLVVLHHGFEKFNEIVEAYREFEKRLAGRKGEYFLVAYTARVVTSYRLIGPHEYSEAHCFRLGVLDDVKLIWNEDGSGIASISVPVSRYVYGNRPPVKENIFEQFSGPNPSPSLLGIHVLGRAKLLNAHPGSSSEDRSYIEEIVVGDKEVAEWVVNNPLYTGFDKTMLKMFGEALEKFDLEPMGENDGPLPQEDNHSLVHPKNEEFVSRLVGEYGAKPVK